MPPIQPIHKNKKTLAILVGIVLCAVVIIVWYFSYIQNLNLDLAQKKLEAQKAEEARMLNIQKEELNSYVNKSSLNGFEKERVRTILEGDKALKFNLTEDEQRKIMNIMNK